MYVCMDYGVVSLHGMPWVVVLKAAATQTAWPSVSRSPAIDSVDWHATTCSVTADNAADSVSLNTTSQRHAVSLSRITIVTRRRPSAGRSVTHLASRDVNRDR